LSKLFVKRCDLLRQVHDKLIGDVCVLTALAIAAYCAAHATQWSTIERPLVVEQQVAQVPAGMMQRTRSHLRHHDP